mmetsp:Transcript_4809/g.8291  ORF Transcript_4809/g.8291 Transcript_4809/m.8291 type:complete len:108 (+) Transcript_4809:762-1085(+)
MLLSFSPFLLNQAALNPFFQNFFDRTCNRKTWSTTGPMSTFQSNANASCAPRRRLVKKNLLATRLGALQLHSDKSSIHFRSLEGKFDDGMNAGATKISAAGRASLEH